MRDTGAGIPPQNLEKIVDPFFTTKEIGKGTGQGLAIARSVIVDKHGGKLTVASELGRGTTFTIAIPLAVEGAAGVWPLALGAALGAAQVASRSSSEIMR